MTLNDHEPQIGSFSDFFCDFLLQKSELRQNGWRQTKTTCEQECYSVSRVSWALGRISCRTYCSFKTKRQTSIKNSSKASRYARRVPGRGRGKGSPHFWFRTTPPCRSDGLQRAGFRREIWNLRMMTVVEQFIKRCPVDCTDQCSTRDVASSSRAGRFAWQIGFDSNEFQFDSIPFNPPVIQASGDSSLSWILSCNLELYYCTIAGTSSQNQLKGVSKNRKPSCC